ncbi:MAG: RNA methyltransferase [Candidatus Sumerlaeaceae bacterium]
MNELMGHHTSGSSRELNAVIRIVLVRPGQARNIGAVIRAAANFSAESVRIVSPAEWSPEAQREARVASSGAWELVDVQVHSDLPEALVGCQAIVGTSVRQRKHVSMPQTPEQLFAAPSRGLTSVVFGPESQGLSSDELDLCQKWLRIPTNPEFPSLNLAQAVLLVLYEAHRCQPLA